MWRTEDPVHMYPCTKARDVTTNFFRRRKWNHPSRVMLLSLLSLYASTYWWKIQISQLHYHDGTNFKAEYWLQKSHFETGFKMPVSNWKIHVTKKHLTSPRYIQKKSHCSGKRIKEHTNLFNWADIILTWMPIWVNQIQEFQIVISLVQFSIDLKRISTITFHLAIWTTGKDIKRPLLTNAVRSRKTLVVSVPTLRAASNLVVTHSLAD